MDRRLYMRQWLLALDRHERRLRIKVARQRNALIRQAAKEYEVHGSVTNSLRTRHEALLSDVLFAHSQQVIPYFGKFALKQVKARHGVFERKASDSLFTIMMEWARTRALNNASTIADTDMADVRIAIENGLAAGQGNAEIARAVRKVSNLTPFRAATVARTETHAAATYGAIEEARQAEQEIGIKLVKAWVPTRDDRTRPAHAAMAYAEPVGLDEQFEVDGEMMDRPGDPSASAENVINCRCAIFTEEAPE